MKAVVAAFNQEKALVGAFSVITNLRIELFQALQGGAARAGAPLTTTQPRHSKIGIMAAPCQNLNGLIPTLQSLCSPQTRDTGDTRHEAGSLMNVN